MSVMSDLQRGSVGAFVEEGRRLAKAGYGQDAHIAYLSLISTSRLSSVHTTATLDAFIYGFENGLRESVDGEVSDD